MLTFECPQFEDRQWVQPLLSAEADPACEYSFASIYLWSRAWPQQIARCGGRLLVRIQGKLGLCYLYPAGSGPLAPAVDALAQDAAANGVPLTLVCVTEAQRAALEEACPGRFAFEEDGVYRVSTGCLAENQGSRRIMEKCGMIKEAERPGWTWHEGEMKTRLEYRLLREEYEKLRQG